MDRKRVEELVLDFVERYENPNCKIEDIKYYVDSLKGEEHKALSLAYDFVSERNSRNSTFMFGIFNSTKREMCELIYDNLRQQS